MNVIFAGTPEFARSALAAIHAAGFSVPLVLTQPDRPAGRGMQRQPSPVKQFAVAHGLPVAQPTSLRTDGKYSEEAHAAIELLRATPHDVMVVAAYGLILPQTVLDIPRYGCLNIHASLLPRWRGAAPIHRAIEAGDPETGIGIMQMEAGLDTGPVALEARLPIAANDTTATLHDKLAALGGELIVKALRQLERDGKLPAVPQATTGITYATKISKDEARLDFTQPAATLAHRIRAFNPFPGASFTLHGSAIKCWQAQAIATPRAGAEPGTVLDAGVDGVVLACADGRALRVTELQKPGGKRLPAREFLQGFPIQAGERLTT